MMAVLNSMHSPWKDLVDTPSTLTPNPTPQLQERSPGPGEYDIGARTSPDGPAYTIRGRLPDPESEESPGPADYQSLCRPGGDAPAFTIRPKAMRNLWVSTDAAMHPGPGQYDVLSMPRPGSPSAPAYTFGGRSNPVGEIKAPDSPGPASYDVPGDPKGPGPAFTFAARTANLEGEPHYATTTTTTMCVCRNQCVWVWVWVCDTGGWDARRFGLQQGWCSWSDHITVHCGSVPTCPTHAKHRTPSLTSCCAVLTCAAPCAVML